MLLQGLKIFADYAHRVAGNPTSRRIDIEFLSRIGFDVVNQRVMQLPICSGKPLLSRSAES